ncbi:hypothetical protein ABKV19_026585 [Rosa sericea]
MGFSHNMVAKAIQEHGLEDADSILETLLLYNALESCPPEQHSLPKLHSPPEQCSSQEQQQIDSDLFSSDYDWSFLGGFSDSSDDEVTIDPTSEAEAKLMSLVIIGYNELEASMAIERCGIDSPLVDLTDFLSAAQISKAEDAHLPLEEMHTYLRSEYPEKNKRKLCESSLLKRKRIMGHGNQIIGDDADAIHLPNPMIGFGTPADLCQIHRSLP